MDINNYKQPEVNQNSNLPLENTAGNSNSTSYLQSATDYLQSVFRPFANLADRTVGYFSKELIPASEFRALCEQQDQESAAQKIVDILSQYSFYKCQSWLYTPVPGYREIYSNLPIGGYQPPETKKIYNETPIELVFNNCIDNKDKEFTALKAIVNLLNQKHQEYDKNAMPLAWLGPQKDSDKESIESNYKIFDCINRAYIITNYEIPDLLYYYENYPNSYCNLGRFASSTLLSCVWSDNLESIKSMLKFLKDNPYDSDGKPRESYIDVFQSLLPNNSSNSLLNINMRHSQDHIRKKNNGTDETISYEIAEELMKFLFTENLLSKQHPSVKDLIHPLYFGDFKKIITTKDSEAKYPYCNALYASFLNETQRKN